MTETNEELIERLRQIAESQRMDFNSPHVGMTLDEAANALAAADARIAELENVSEPATRLHFGGDTVSDVREKLAEVLFDAWNDERGNEVPFLSSEARTKLADAILAAFPTLGETAGPSGFVIGAPDTTAPADGACEGVSVNRYWCTREVGHHGVHAAGNGITIVDVWEQAEGTEE